MSHSDTSRASPMGQMPRAVSSATLPVSIFALAFSRYTPSLVEKEPMLIYSTIIIFCQAPEPPFFLI